MSEQVLVLPATFSEAEVCASLGISRQKVDQLARDGVCGFIRGKRNAKRFTIEHYGQIVAAISTPARVDIGHMATLGITSTASRRRRNQA